jgi:hypothetical protein
MYGLLKCKEKGRGFVVVVAERQWQPGKQRFMLWCLRLAYHSGSDELSCGQNWGAASARIEYYRE